MSVLTHPTSENFPSSNSGNGNDDDVEMRENYILFPCNDPVEPAMRNEAVRLNTFGRWPFGHTVVPPRRIAQSGLYYLGSGDQTKCFYCGGGLQDWSRDDDPWVEHAKWFPECEFLLHERGPAWVSEITSRFPNIHRPNMTEVRRLAEQSSGNPQQQSSMWRGGNMESNIPSQTASVISQPQQYPEPPRIPSFQSSRPRSPNLPFFNPEPPRRPRSPQSPRLPRSPEPPRRPRSPQSPRIPEPRPPRLPRMPRSPRRPRSPRSPRSPNLPTEFMPSNIFTLGTQNGRGMNLGEGGTSITVEGSTLRIVGGQNVSIIRRGNQTTVSGIGGNIQRNDENIPEIRAQLSTMGYTRQEIDDAIDTYRNRSGSGEITLEAVLDELHLVSGEPQPYQPPPPPASTTETSNKEGESGETQPTTSEQQQQQSSVTTSGPCVVCLENMKEMVMVPCGHFCACRSCVRHLSRCPVCRTHIERTVRFFEA